MNNINITHELCAEDRARLDRLADLLEQRITQAQRIMLGEYGSEASGPDQIDLDEVQQKLAETMAKAKAPTEPAKNTTEEAQTSTTPTTQLEEEKPTHEEDAPEEEPAVTLEMIQQKVVQLAAHNGGTKKAKVRAIINAHGARVSDLKEKPEAWTKVWEQLTALEKED